MNPLLGVCALTTISITLIGHSECDAASLTTEESIVRNGYPVEKYKLQTQDKYILGLERIPFSKRDSSRTVGKPVLLLHGLFLSSYVFAFSNNSLCYSLSEAGYDVWLFNARGTGLSRTFSIYTKLGSPPRMNRILWDFSFQEMGVYDFTAAIDFISNTTGHQKIDVVGYSLGATIALVGLSEKPAYNKKVDKLVLMAPTTRLMAFGFPVNLFYRSRLLFKYGMINQAFFPMTQDPDASHRFLRWLCTYKVLYPWCWVFVNTAQGTRIKYNKENVISVLTDFPQPVSKKLLVHLIQLMSSKKFAKYDYGYSGNMRRYNSKTPPEYNLAKVTVPTFILHSRNDRLSAKADVQWLSGKLPNLKEVYFISKIKFGHLSFVMHTNLEPLVNEKIKNALIRNTLNHTNAVQVPIANKTTGRLGLKIGTNSTRNNFT